MVARVAVVALALVVGEHQMELEHRVKAQMEEMEIQQTMVVEAEAVLRLLEVLRLTL
jgi:hypothetical protein